MIMEFDLLGLNDQKNNNQPTTQPVLGSLQHDVQKMRKVLVPNYQALDHCVQSRIEDCIMVLLGCSDKAMIQSYCRLGLVDEAPLLRSCFWKLMLESLPVKHMDWEARKQHNYQTYNKLIQSYAKIEEIDLLGFDAHDNSHSLSSGTFVPFDQALWDQIMLDAVRTHSALNFFQSQVPNVKVYQTKPTKHFDVLTRILYIWAKCNGGVRYVQGMNEILAPVYYLQFQQPRKESESEIFFMFSALITPVIDMHIKDMDKSDQGIGGRMNTLNKYLKALDPQIWHKLEQEGIHPQFYSFRWLALMLSQEFSLWDTMRLWDVLLSYDHQRRFRYLYCLCVAIIKLRKKEILQKEFTEILPRLQKLKDLDVGEVLELGKKLYQKFGRVDIDKYLVRQEQKKQEKAEEEARAEEPVYKQMYRKTENLLQNLYRLRK